MADRNRSLLVVWLAVRGFSCLEMELKKKKKKRAKGETEEKREVDLPGVIEKKRNLVEEKP